MTILGFEIGDGCIGSPCLIKKPHGQMVGGCICIPRSIPFGDRILIHKELIKQGYPK
jgi:hypothetical protein